MESTTQKTKLESNRNPWGMLSSQGLSGPRGSHPAEGGMSFWDGSRDNVLVQPLNLQEQIKSPWWYCRVRSLFSLSSNLRFLKLAIFGWDCWNLLRSWKACPERIFKVQCPAYLAAVLEGVHNLTDCSRHGAAGYNLVFPTFGWDPPWPNCWNLLCCVVDRTQVQSQCPAHLAIVLEGVPNLARDLLDGAVGHDPAHVAGAVFGWGLWWALLRWKDQISFVSWPPRGTNDKTRRKLANKQQGRLRARRPHWHAEQWGRAPCPRQGQWRHWRQRDSFWLLCQLWTARKISQDFLYHLCPRLRPVQHQKCLCTTSLQDETEERRTTTEKPTNSVTTWKHFVPDVHLRV